MRRLPLPLLFLVAIASVFIACHKEVRETLPGTSADQVHAKSDVNTCMVKVEFQCGMLSFQTSQHFQEVYDCLSEAYESHLNDFEDQYGYLSEDDYNAMSDQLGFVDEQPLIDFETAFGFTSYRANLAAVESAFLAGGGDPEFGPESVFEDEVMEAMVNTHGAVMVGGRINMVNEQGAGLYCPVSVTPEGRSGPANPRASGNSGLMVIVLQHHCRPPIS